MVVVPSASARERGPLARTSESRLWWAFVGTGLFLCLVFVLIPSSQVLARDGIIYPLTEAGAVLAIVAGVRRYRPSYPAAWLLIAAGLALWLVGDVVWGAYQVQGRSPYPSPADFFYLAGYPVMAAGLVLAVLRRGAAVDGRAWLDAAIIAVVGALFAWVFLAGSAIDDPSLSLRETVVAVSYTFGDLLLLVVAARFVTGSITRVRSLRLLVLGLGFTLAGDVLFALSLVGDHPGFTGDELLLLGVVCIGAAGLHETMPALTKETDEPLLEGSETRRLVLLGAACLAPVAVLVVEAARGDTTEHLPSVVAAMGVIAILAVLRSNVVTHRALRAAERESALSAYAAELLRSNGEEDLFAVAARAASQLLEDGEVSVVPPLTELGTHAFTAPVDVRGERVAVVVADGSPLTIRRTRDSLTTVANELSLALERERLLESERDTAAALSEQNERLRELDKMKDQFVSTVSHELRTPLTSMIGYLEILIGSDVGELAADEQRHFLEIVDRNCQRLNRLVDDILNAARIDSGRFTLERTTVDLPQLAAERVESIRAAAEHGQVNLRLTIERTPPPLQADPMRLGQLLDNLLSNAIKFTPPGGTVSLSLGTRGERVHFEVADTGVGVPPDEVDKLFGRFFRASTAATVQGTGLGLSIAKAIVEAHGGEISVESEVGVGTTFVVDLPMQASQEDVAAGRTAEAVR
jgi:signal transduction histidine kinase